MANISKRELVSVVVTSFNHAEYLSVRIESLLKQTYENIEIIIVDDCSTDNSVEILKKYTYIKRIRLIALAKNIGYARATNLGVMETRGQFVMIAESDDFNDPTHIEVLYNAIKSDHEIGVAYCRSNIVDYRGVVTSNDFANRDSSFRMRCHLDTKIAGLEMLKHLLIGCVIPNMSAALIRKSIFAKVNGLSSEYRACADWDFWCRMSFECDFYYIVKPLNNFRVHSSSHIKLSAVNLLLSEIIKLLYNSLNRANFSFMEKLKFRINIGVVIASYSKKSPIIWINKLPDLLIDCVKFDKVIPIFVLIGFLKLAISKIFNLLNISNTLQKIF
jgi:glycosyltransferase involved in cell wall biosynthesis